MLKMTSGRLSPSTSARTKRGCSFEGGGGMGGAGGRGGGKGSRFPGRWSGGRDPLESRGLLDEDIGPAVRIPVDGGKPLRRESAERDERRLGLEAIGAVVEIDRQPRNVGAGD